MYLTDTSNVFNRNIIRMIFRTVPNEMIRAPSPTKDL